MKIDMHVHMKRTSNCAREEPETMAKKATEKGIDGIVLLDHHYFPTEEECEKVEELYPNITIFKGTEISVIHNGGRNDITFISTDPPNCFFGAYRKPISPTDLPDLLKWIEDTNGLSILQHPYRKNKPIVIDLEKYKLDCIEVASNNTPKKHRLRIIETAKKYDMICVSTSDAHKARELGGYCISTDKRYVSNESELADVVKSRCFSLLETRMASVQHLARNE